MLLLLMLSHLIPANEIGVLYYSDILALQNTTARCWISENKVTHGTILHSLIDIALHYQLTPCLVHISILHFYFLECIYFTSFGDRNCVYGNFSRRRTPHRFERDSNLRSSSCMQVPSSTTLLRAHFHPHFVSLQI